MKIHLFILMCLHLTPPLIGCSKPPGELRYDSSWEASPPELYETGIVLADVTGDGHADLITASGNDEGHQPVAVYMNDGAGAFPSTPSWTSDDLDANMGAAAGDIDRDGRLDLCVATLGAAIGGGGGVKVYLNRNGMLEKTPSYRTRERYHAFTCALGDADGDGDLDLGASVMGGLEAPRAGNARIYFNEGGALEDMPRWKAQDPPVFGGGLLFADVQGDGFLDLVQGSYKVSVYAGAMGPDRRVALGNAPSWSSQEGEMTFYVAAGPVGMERKWGLVVSRNLAADTEPAAARYELYYPGAGSPAPVWRSSGKGLGGGVKLADVNGDAVSDLLGTAWGIDAIGRGPFEIHLGDGEHFKNGPAFTSDPSMWHLGQALDAADLQGRCTVSRTWSTTIDTPRAVISLPDPLIGSIGQVARNGAPLGAEAYASVPGAPWLSFTERLNPGDKIEVAYGVPRQVDIAIAYQHNSSGARLLRYAAAPASICRR